MLKDAIFAKLNEIEKEKQVKILYAVESGSRAWGFESKDSDYDVRFIYIHPRDWYLSIESRRDVIEYPISGLLDVNGWDVKKALKLFENSNPPLYEWLNSPIVYLEKGNFAKNLRTLMPKFYSPVACTHHYLSMAKRNYKAYLSRPKVIVKKYFYTMRPIFACMWIERNKTMPPTEFKKLFEVQDLKSQLRENIRKLLERKQSGEELDVEDRIKAINAFLIEKINYFEEYTKKFRIKRDSDFESLDNLFREMLF